tara:strand:- start:989 stop:1165 length:177 start_codon:yes stop_codon:yes gene_type:complete
MLTPLLASLIALNNPMDCEFATKLINNIGQSVEARLELIELIQLNSEEGCFPENAQVD